MKLHGDAANLSSRAGFCNAASNSLAENSLAEFRCSCCVSKHNRENQHLSGMERPRKRA